MKLRDDAVYLVSYPRSGNTLMRFLIANYQYPDKVINWKTVEWAIPNLRSRLFTQSHTSIVKDWNPLVFKIHQSNFKGYKGARVIYIYRDGRDVALSYYHFSKFHPQVNKENRCRIFDEFLQKFLLGGIEYGSWKEHVKKWAIDKRRTSPLLVLKYEEALSEPRDALRSIIDFLGWKYNDAILKAAVEKSQYLRMKKVGLRKAIPMWKIGHTGSAGLWGKTFTAEQRELFLNTAGGVLEKLGYEV